MFFINPISAPVPTLNPKSKLVFLEDISSVVKSTRISFDKLRLAPLMEMPQAIVSLSEQGDDECLSFVTNLPLFPQGQVSELCNFFLKLCNKY